jgi:hypothetical protein
MIAALLLCAYSTRPRSSRANERAWVDDVAVRVVPANWRPDHCTIARFRRRQEAARPPVRVRVRALRGRRPGWSGSWRVAGTKVHANASQHPNLDYDQIAHEILAKAAQPRRARHDSAAEPAYWARRAAVRGGVCWCSADGESRSMVRDRGVRSSPRPHARGHVEHVERERADDRRGHEVPPELATVHGRRSWLHEASAPRRASQREITARLGTRDRRVGRLVQAPAPPRSLATCRQRSSSRTRSPRPAAGLSSAAAAGSYTTRPYGLAVLDPAAPTDNRASCALIALLYTSLMGRVSARGRQRRSRRRARPRAWPGSG